MLRDHDGEPTEEQSRPAATLSTIRRWHRFLPAAALLLVLYFSSLSGDKIVKEMRNVHYSTNTTLEKVILEQLAAGPMNSKLSGVLSEEVRVLDVKVSEKTLYTESESGISGYSGWNSNARSSDLCHG